MVHPLGLHPHSLAHQTKIDWSPNIGRFKNVNRGIGEPEAPISTKWPRSLHMVSQQFKQATELSASKIVYYQCSTSIRSQSQSPLLFSSSHCYKPEIRDLLIGEEHGRDQTSDATRKAALLGEAAVERSCRCGDGGRLRARAARNEGKETDLSVARREGERVAMAVETSVVDGGGEGGLGEEEKAVNPRPPHHRPSHPSPARRHHYLFVLLSPAASPRRSTPDEATQQSLSRTSLAATTLIFPSPPPAAATVAPPAHRCCSSLPLQSRQDGRCQGETTDAASRHPAAAALRVAFLLASPFLAADL
ncbi:hypothetical protein Tsubulata_004212 [Turnera subulata]|uniref:Uncharacterized protein n=1 Tax=Turnera subulata TaxID=218843 RepID=A0A9Q0FRB1_9ROSI|nr:hypothetical protein Tsubulata_004212 [Turnera subulata]